MNLFEYMQSDKYKNYERNDLIFMEKSSGIFYKDVVSRVKLELMGSGAIITGDKVLTGFSQQKASYSPISSLIVPSNILSASSSAYISYSTSGSVTFDNKLNPYLEKKIKEILRVQSVGGSVLVKKVEKDGRLYLNLYTPLSYFAVNSEYIQDIVESYNIFNMISDDDEKRVYLVETHIDNLIKYQYIEVDKESKTAKKIDTEIESLSQGVEKEGDKEIIYSFESLSAPIVSEVVNICFDGESDYTDDNVSLLRELVVTNTINSQTFDKISNPLLALPEEAIEYDLDGTARVNLQDRVVIIRDGATKPEQIKLESKIEQAQIHKGNIEDNIYSSLATSRTALGITDSSQLSGEALRRMISATIARVEEKRGEVAQVFEDLLGIEVKYEEVVIPSFSEKVDGVEKAVTAGVMSVEKGATIVSGEEDYQKILKEKALEYEGLNVEDE